MYNWPFSSFALVPRNISRTAFKHLQATWLLPLALSLTACTSVQHETHIMSSTTNSSHTLQLMTGGYTDKGGEGIYGVSYDPLKNQFGELRLLAKTHHPSFGLQAGKHWYWVDEDAQGQLLTYASNDKNGLDLLQKISAAGASPCHLSLRGDANYLAVSNYKSGNVAVYKLDSTGIPQAQPQVLQHAGAGPDTSRQEGPHAHWAGWSQLPDNKKTLGMYAVDLGVDKIFWYPQDTNGKFGEAQVALTAKPGDGPRHIVFHPQQPWVYLLNELSNTVSFTRQEADGQLTEQQKLGTLPADFQGKNISAHIAISADGKRLYTSNRGHHSIAVFNIAENGQLALAQIIDSQGQWPRFFVLLDEEKKLVVANQDSDNLAVFNILSNGQLAYSGVQTHVPRPTFVGVSR